MKKLIITSLFVISVLSNTYAQFTKIGGGVALSSGFPFHNMPYDANKSGIIAVSFKGLYEINTTLHISPSFTFFYPHITQELSTKTNVSSLMFDINGHYVFNSLEKFEFYVLAGFDMLYTNKKETSGSIIFKESDNALGLNIGVGTYMKVTEQLNFFGEAKYIFSRYDQFMINAGVFLNIDWMKKN